MKGFFVYWENFSLNLFLIYNLTPKLSNMSLFNMNLPARQFLKNLVLIFGSIIILIGCKKDDSTELSSTQNSNLKAATRQSTLQPHEIINWLNNQIRANTPLKNKNIKNINSNMLMSERQVEHFRGEENMIIIPLKRNYFSQYIKEGDKPLQYLLVIEDAKGAIRRADVVLFYPKDLSVQSVPKNAFHDFFTNCSFPVNGTFSLINLSDKRQYEFDFSDNKMRSSRMWQGKKAIAQTNFSSTTTAPENLTCTEWYLITTYYYDDGSTEEYRQYLGTTCTSCPPNEVCGIEGGPEGGGGGFSTPPEAKQVQVSFIVASSQASTESWTMHAWYKLDGVNYPDDASQNYFAAVPYSISNTNVSTSTMLFGSGFMHTYTLDHNYIVFQLVHDNVGLSNSDKTAWANFSAILNWPNRTAPYPSQTVHTRAQSWPAAIVLH